MCYVYVLRSEKTGKRYVGITENHERRMVEHNSGQTPSTRSGIPWRMIHNEAHESRAAAMRRERFLKSGRGRAWLDRLEGDGSTGKSVRLWRKAAGSNPASPTI